MNRSGVRRRSKVALAAALTASALLGCPHEPDPSAPDAGAPAAPDAVVDPAARRVIAPPRDWVGRGTHQAGGVVYGVGKAVGIKNPALARSTAANRARAEVARVVGQNSLKGVQVIEYSRTARGTTYALAVYGRPSQ